MASALLGGSAAVATKLAVKPQGLHASRSGAANVRSTVRVMAMRRVEAEILEPVETLLRDPKNQASAAAVMAGSVFSMLATSETAMAAQEVAAIAEGDNRALLLLGILLPAVGWVLFNILRPALNQLDKMRSSSTVAAAGVGAAAAALIAAPDADAAQVIAQVADDNRPLLLLLVVAPALGWVLFNILKPALNQINKMQGKAVAGAVGLGAAGSLLLAPSADAAQAIAQVADDSRPLLLLVVLAPAIGWVLFNILKPALNQINKMQGKAVAGAVGLGAAASLLAAPSADAAQEIATLADDSRPLLLLLVLGPAIGWVLFNILRPALNQLDKMQGKK